MEASSEESRLYAVSLEDFIEERDALARKLKDEGDAEGSARVKRLQKPNLSAWTVNQLVRHRRAAVEELGDTISRAAAASAKEMRDLTASRRRLIGELLDEARKTLEQAGHGAGATTLNDVSQTLQAIGSEEARDEVLAGRLTRPLAPTGFEAFGATTLVDEPEAPRPTGAQRKKAERLAKEAERAAREADRLEREADEARAAAESAKGRAQRARKEAIEAQAAADEALGALDGR